MPLPKGVYRIKRWWYYQHRRGRPDHGPNIALPEFGTPEFWAKMAEIETGHAGPRPFTFDALIADYKANGKYTKLSEGSRSTYGPALNYIANRWGSLRVDGLTPPHIQAFLDEEFAEHPSMGNLTLSVLKTVLRFGVSHGYIAANPAREIENLEEEGRSAVPWPEWVWRKIVAEGPTEVVRLSVLGRATGQRISDLKTMMPRNRSGAGLYTSIKKLGIIDPTHWCPLTPEFVAIIDGWAVFPHTKYISDDRGQEFSEDRLRDRLYDYVASEPELASAGVPIKPHGLRALAVCDRRIAGQAHQVISAAIGMSLRQVMHYSRHIDQRLAAGGEREQNEPMKTQGPVVKTPKPK